MTKTQRWWFILLTLPLCTLILAIGISEIGRNANVTLRVGNIRSSKNLDHQYSDQEKLNIGEYRY